MRAEAAERVATDAGAGARVVRRYVLPGPGRRVLLLAGAALVGAAVAASLARSPSGGLVLAGLALLAGISSMWSP